MNARPQRAKDVFRLRRWQPRADDIRYMGRCDVCRRPGLYTYVLAGEPRVLRHAERDEECGYWCASCNFSNAGSRPYEGEG